MSRQCIIKIIFENLSRLNKFGLRCQMGYVILIHLLSFIKFQVAKIINDSMDWVVTPKVIAYGSICGCILKLLELLEFQMWLFEVFVKNVSDFGIYIYIIDNLVGWTHSGIHSECCFYHSQLFSGFLFFTGLLSFVFVFFYHCLFFPVCLSLSFILSLSFFHFLFFFLSLRFFLVLPFFSDAIFLAFFQVFVFFLMSFSLALSFSLFLTLFSALSVFLSQPFFLCHSFLFS